jgi:hypothetical protein
MELRTLQIVVLSCSCNLKLQNARRGSAESHCRSHPLSLARESGENLMTTPGNTKLHAVQRALLQSFELPSEPWRGIGSPDSEPDQV